MPEFNIPKEVSYVTEALENAGFEAFLVGGCVRDLFLKIRPKDWDITTNARPEDIQKLYTKTVYENKYGTVKVINEDVSDETLKIIEITPYRTETVYSDNRRPDEITFSNKIEDDLQRRDFTMNAIAYRTRTNSILDIYGGIKDIGQGIIKTVGVAEDRFKEDALRMLRAIRFSAELEFSIEKDTANAIRENAFLMKNISKERVRDEFTRIMNSQNPTNGLILSHKLGILTYIIPELEEGIDIEQGGMHKHDVWMHLLKSLDHAVSKGWPLHVKLAVLFHDIGKPRSRRAGQKKEWTFYGHEVIGAKITSKIMGDLKFPKDIADKVVKLVRWHMFFSDTEQISPSAARRMIANVGKDLVWDLMNVRMADRIGMGRPKEDPYRLRKYQALIEEVMQDPVTVSMLKIDGNTLIEKLHMKPGPKIGYILHALLEEVLEDPKLNNETFLVKRAGELNELSDAKLKKLGESGKEKQEEVQEEEVKKIRGKYKVD